VPVFNAERSLPALVDRLEAALDGTGADYELILVDDGSADGSWERIVELSGGHGSIRGIRLTKNFGQHNALLAGVREAANEIVVTLDDDLQNPPEEIPKLLAKLDEGHDVVYGTPLRERHNLWRRLASRATKVALESGMGKDVATKVSAFRAFRSSLRDAFTDFRGPYVSLDVLLTWATGRFAAVGVRHDDRAEGRSNYSFRRLVRHALTMLTGFSIWPLRLASVIGFVFTVFGVGAFLYVLGRRLVEGDSVPGFPFLASLVAILAGAQLFALGVMGEYFARLYLRSMGIPSYAVRDEVGGGAQPIR
jgi:undecaprenyl-phosphate 4-deoxy-4-formamido-L-arabinose transferase